MLTRFAVLCLACACACACARKSPSTKETPQRAKPSGLDKYILDKAPEISHPLEVTFGDRVVLLGYDVEPAGALPLGKDVTLTLYWRLREVPAGNWKLSTHVVDGNGEQILDLYNASPIRAGKRGQPRTRPSRWSLDKVYVDKLKFKLPPALNTPQIKVLAGVYSTDAVRMQVTQGQGDTSDRALVAAFDVAVEKPVASLAKLTGEELAIDGALDEPAWQKAPVLGPLISLQAGGRGKTSGKTRAPADAGTQQPPVRSTARMLWNDRALYVGIHVQDKSVTGGFDPKQRDAELWTRDAVALMLDADGDGNLDYEIQINPQNLVYDAQTKAPGGSDAGPSAKDVAWSSRLTSRVVVNGKLDADDQPDDGYVVEAMIPWANLEKLGRKAPELGSSFNLSVYAFDQGQAAGWPPAGAGDVRSAARFGTLRFVEGAAKSAD